jgi:hypothetical protein
MKQTMEDRPDSVAIVSFDDSDLQESPVLDMLLDYEFAEVVPQNEEGMEVESESMMSDDTMTDPSSGSYLVSLELSTPSAQFPGCFLDFQATESYFSAEATEVSEDDTNSSISSSLEHRFEETARRLAESMAKSRKTRFSLTIDSPTFEDYPRRKSITTVVTSVEESSYEILSQVVPSPSYSHLQ